VVDGALIQASVLMTAANAEIPVLEDNSVAMVDAPVQTAIFSVMEHALTRISMITIVANAEMFVLRVWAV
jgi:hypothetical protein